MSKIEVDQITQQSGTTITVGGGACKTAVVDATTVTLGRTGATVSLAPGASQSGFGRTGTVNWCTTAKTSPFTSVSGKGYFVNTTSGAITVTLPASPSAGDIVAVKDYAKTFDTNNVTLGRNSSKIGGACLDATLSTEGLSTTLVYVDGTQGWLVVIDGQQSEASTASYVTATGGNAVVTCGNFKTHIFTADGTFCVSAAGNACGSNTVDYFVVAGGGGGGGFRSGGGGAGGFRLSNSLSIPAPTMSPLSNPTGLPVSATGYPITVGGGGPGATGPGAPGQYGAKGSDSVFSTITSTGGGGGGADSDPPGPGGHDGGSGGGAACSSVGPGSGGSGNTPPVSPSQGNPGGFGAQAAPVSSATPVPHAGGGGGGAGAPGGDRSQSPGSNGGPGGIGSYIADPFVGPTAPSYGTSGPVSSTRYFAGGGGGAGCTGGNPGASVPGGAGGGGSGDETLASVTGGSTNTGGGGGARGHYSPNPGPNPNGAGGSGIVMIRYRYQ